MKRSRFLVFLLMAVLSFSCSSFGGGYTGGYPEAAAFDSEAVMEGYRDAPAPAAKQAAPSASAMVAEELSVSLEALPPGAPPERPVERLRVYSGFGRLVVEDVDTVKEDVSRTAEENGGYVEGIWENTIIIRVPAGMFQELFDRVLTFGEVDYKRIETVDVTEYFTDISTRLTIAGKTRDRLYRLLEKTEDVDERLRILREIRRLTEEIEGMSNTLRSLEKRIAFSRIQLELLPRLAAEGILSEGIPFPWIARLNPLYPGLEALKKPVEVPLDDTFAIFSEDEIFRAENSRGVRVRVSGTENLPVGDTDFWGKALRHHLSPLYAETKPVEFQEGAMKGCLFTSKDTEPFYYAVLQRVVGEDIIVFEVFFPDSLRLEESGEKVFDAFDRAVLP